MKRIILILRIKLVLSFLFLLFSDFSVAQQFKATHLEPHSSHLSKNEPEKCAVLLIEQQQEASMGIFGSRDYFESWMDEKLQEKQNTPRLRIQADEIRQIPVVVHIIHNGTPVGEGANIPLSQIQAQIDILNEDYRRLNEDATNTPDEFRQVAVDAHIEFVLAKQDPRGLPTDGINRVEGPQDVYSPGESSLISEVAFWPSEEYLNIWVAPLESPYIGYASFPTSDLPGLNFPPNSRETDGVTIDYRYFGEGGNAANASRGRTATHEIGHFFGLRHIWGDGDCEVDDYVEDTPNQSQSNNSCRTSPRITCDSRDMIENFMDYTPDQCMNLFTAGQLERFNVVLESSPRRASLVNNRATQEPDLSALDIALEQIIVPQDYICQQEVTPEIAVFNAGANAVFDVRMEVTLNGQVVETKDFSLNLQTGERDTLSFAPITLTTSNNDFEANVISVNGTADGNPENDMLRSAPIIQPIISPPYDYEANDFEELWTVKNEDGQTTWEPTEQVLGGITQNLITINNYNYENQGRRDYFISPQIDLSNTPEAQLVFEVAHAEYPTEGFEDRLLVAVSTDCGNSFDLLDAPYDKGGNTLSTVNGTTNEYTPSGQADFRTELVNLSDYAGMGNIRIAFVAVNGYGNNIFIKNISLKTSEEFRYDFRLEEVVSPSPITDGSQESEILQLTNTGNLPISTFLLDRTVNGRSPETLIANGEDIVPGETILLELPNSLVDGDNEIIYRIYQANFDQSSGRESSLQRFYIQDGTSIRVPWRQNFNSESFAPWHSINPENGDNSWEIISKQSGELGDNLANLRNLANDNSYWIGTPVMDLSGTRQASAFFDFAANGVDGNTRLRILASSDGGVTFDQEVGLFEGEALNTVTGSSPLNPNDSDAFSSGFVDLTDFTGEGNEKFRMAFVVEQGNPDTNPVYLDNIEFFLSNNPDPVYPGIGNSVLYPNPATDIFNIAFNLENFEDVQIQVISLAGQVVHDVTYPNTLNQTYSFSTSLFSKGVFVVKVISGSVSQTQRLIIY